MQYPIIPWHALPREIGYGSRTGEGPGRPVCPHGITRVIAPGGRVQCSPLWCTTLRSVAASRLRMEGREFSSNTIGIPCMEKHRWAEGRGVPAIWFGLNEVRTHSANFAGGGTLNGMECFNQGPSRTLNGMEHSVWGVRGSNLGSELNFSITNTSADISPAEKSGRTSEGDWNQSMSAASFRLPSLSRVQGGEGVRGFIEDIGVGETISRIKSYVSALVRLANFGTGFKIFFWGYVVHTFLQVIPAGKSSPRSPSSLWENRF